MEAGQGCQRRKNKTMIVKDDDAIARLNSPLNLINKMVASQRKNAMSLFIPQEKTTVDVSIKKEEKVKTTFNPFPAQPKEAQDSEKDTKIDDILDDNEARINLALAHDRAINLLNNSLSLLSEKLDDVRADKLPGVIAAAARTVEGIRKERNESAKSNKDREVHYHFYTPEQRKITDYEIIEVAQ